MKQKIKLSELVKDINSCQKICRTNSCDNCIFHQKFIGIYKKEREFCLWYNHQIIKPELLEKEVEIEVPASDELGIQKGGE